MGVGRVILSPSVQDQPERKLLETPGISLPYFLIYHFQVIFFVFLLCNSFCATDWNMNDILLIIIL